MVCNYVIQKLLSIPIQWYNIWWILLVNIFQSVALGMTMNDMVVVEMFVREVVRGTDRCPEPLLPDWPRHFCSKHTGSHRLWARTLIAVMVWSSLEQRCAAFWWADCVGQGSSLLFDIICRVCMLSGLAEVGAVRNENTALWRIYQVGSLYRWVKIECSRTSIVGVSLYFVLFATALHAFPYAFPTLFGMICIYPPAQ